MWNHFHIFKFLIIIMNPSIHFLNVPFSIFKLFNNLIISFNIFFNLMRLNISLFSNRFKPSKSWPYYKRSDKCTNPGLEMNNTRSWKIMILHLIEPPTSPSPCNNNWIYNAWLKEWVDKIIINMISFSNRPRYYLRN